MIAHELHPLTLVPTHPFRIARSEHTAYHHWVVRLEEDGDEGWGEAAPSRRYGRTAKVLVFDAVIRLLSLILTVPF